MRSPLRGFRLRDIVILTLPLAAATAWVLGGALMDYHVARQFDDWWSRGFRLGSFVDARIHSMLSLPAALGARRELDAEAEDAGIVRLDVADEDWRGLTGDAQEGWSSWSAATLVRHGEPEQVDLRKRGDTSVHWLGPKRSFTLRTDRGSLFKGHRELAFSVKTVMSQHLSASLAGEFGLLAPSSDISAVFVNDLFYGLFRVVEPIDESFLRRHGRLPGNVFEGEVAERGERFIGLPRGVFFYPYTWTRAVANTRPAADSSSILVDFLEDLHGGGLDAHRRTMARLDRDEMARFVAYLLIVGDPYHMDNLHNQFWYEDPSTGTLHPVPWDVRLLDLGEPPTWVNHLLHMVLRDPFVVDRTAEVLEQTLSGGIEGRAQALLDDVARRYAPHLRFEQAREDEIPEIEDPQDVLSLLRGNLSLLGRWLEDVRFAYGSGRDAAGRLIVDLESRGYVGADLVSLDLGPAIPSGTPGVVLDADGDGRAGPGDPPLAGAWERTDGSLRFVPATPLPLLPGWETDGPGIGPGRVHYRLFVTGVAGSPEVSVRPGLRARHGGADVVLEPWEVGERIPSSSSFSPWLFPRPRPRSHRLSGTVHLAETLRIPVGDTLYIDAGTTVSLDPDVSVVSRGPVFASGTAERPIRIRPASTEGPWGAFALLGPGASGSRLEQVRFEGGGGATVDRVELIGMVNVHHARDVSLTRVELADNVRSDDSFHAVHSEVRLAESRFLRANGDAVDFDYSGGEIRDCIFEASRNDAIDLMTSTPLIVGNHISGSGDKGISVGEASRPTIVGNRIVGSTRGIEVKDRSEPLIVHNTIADDGVGVAELVKNWRYGGGGWAKLIGNALSGNETDTLRDADSRITFAGRPETAEGASAAELEWVYAGLGMRPEAPGPGAPSAWTAVPRADVLDSAVYEEGFRDANGGWEPVDAHGRAEIRGPVLVASAERFAATIRRPVSWELDEGRRYLLVLELAPRNARDARVRLTGGPAPVSTTLPSGGDGRTFRYVTLDVPPGSYSSIEVDVAPLSGAGEVNPQTGFLERASGRLLVRRFTLLAIPERTNAGD